MIVVTGASKGLGRAVCEWLLAAEVEVFGIARDVSGVPFPAVACDVSAAEQVKAVVRGRQESSESELDYFYVMRGEQIDSLLDKCKHFLAELLTVVPLA